MPTINVLSKEIAELIAAGEVIERPSSVIKELIENSIDSGANTIIVEIKNGGTTYMRVTDNGCGISENDIKKAFLRHATSKITSRDDLNKILTLGFRGEALASITAVSKVEVLTKTADEDYGTHYVIEGSEEKAFEKSGCPDGTTIVIRDIFYNVPARLKFLKKDVTEGNAIANIVNKIAISHPDISVKFIRDNKQELFTPGDAELYSSVYSVYGKAFAETLIPVDYTQNNIRVQGFISKPLQSRGNRTMQTFFINGRFVKSVTCMVALEEGYKNSIMVGKFPACVLELTIPPEVVDVNVHPAKTEVRFSDEHIIFDSVYFAVKNALLKNDTPTEIKIKERPPIFPPKQDFKANQGEQIKMEEKPKPAWAPVVSYDDEPEEKVQPKNENVDIKVFSPLKSDGELKLAQSTPDNQAGTVAEKVDCYQHTESYNTEDDIFSLKKPQEKTELHDFKYINSESFVKKEPVEEPKPVVEEKPEIRIIGEAFRTYIIAEVKNELIMIDKHAAHERVLFEQFKSGEGCNYCQELIIGEKMTLSEDECAAIKENPEAVTNMGFIINVLNNTEVEIKGVPSYLSETRISDIVSEIAQNLVRCRNNPEPDALDDMLHTMACKAAIKGHDKNDVRELKKLAEIVYNNEKIRYCPHGRPVLIKMTEYDLERQFKRLV